MPLYRNLVRIPMTTGVSEDAVVNTWYCIADDLTALNLFHVQLTTFYNAVDALYSSACASTFSIKSYDMADPEPRAAVVNLTGITFSPGATQAPPELAVCVSFQAPQQSGLPQARRRGRIYLGPFASTIVGTSNGRVVSTAMTTIGTALQNLLDASQAATTWAWSVYSKTNDAAIEVTNAWMDDAFDIQRRRGTEPLNRNTFV